MGRRALVVTLGLLAALAVLVAAGWRSVSQAKVALNGARSSLQRVVSDPKSLESSEGRLAARATVDRATEDLRRARRSVTGSLALDVCEFVPLASRQRSGILQLIDDATSAAGKGRQLLDRANMVADAGVAGVAVPLDQLAQLESDARSAGLALGGLTRSPKGLWGSLGSARRKFNDVATKTSSRLLRGADELRSARGFFGASEARRYLVAGENNAEMRDRGMVLSYAVIRLERGRISVEKSGSIHELTLNGPVEMPVPAGMSTLFGDQGPSQLWEAVNATADFKWTAATMVQMYAKATGTVVDGVIAIDVPGLAELLKQLGPLTIPGINEQLTADNVGRILLHDLYNNLPPDADQSRRREVLAQVAATAFGKLGTEKQDLVGLGNALAHAASGGHLRLWSRAASEERTFEEGGLGGGVGVKDPARTFHVAVQGVNATKLDYFVQPSVRMAVSLTPLGTAVVRTYVTIDNTAPVGAPPSYQLGPHSGTTGTPGDYVTRTQLWGPAGSTQLGSVPEAGLVANQQTVDVGPQKQKTIMFETIVPTAIQDGRLELRLVPQPRLSPMALEVTLTAPGWRIASGAKSIHRSWDSTIIATWELRH